MRPERLVVVVGTGTEVGKTWVSARLLATLRAAGVTVAARKPAQSFSPGDEPAGLDAAVLGAASGEPAATVCKPHRCYEVAMAPPIAADVLGRGRFTMAELAGELEWPRARVEVGLVESAGGVRSPLSHDGDVVALVDELAPDLVLLVADAGLGTLNAVRLCIGVLPESVPVVTVVNRYDAHVELHVRNRRWLREQDGLHVVGLPGEESALAELVRGR